MAELAEIDQALKLGQVFDILIRQKYNHLYVPDPIVTPTGITHLDALLGGGITSSGPVLLSSTPESGKSTFAFQFSSIFQNLYPNSIILYLDIEGSGNNRTTQYRMNRIDRFGLDIQRFKYQPVMTDILTLFELIKTLVDMKKQFEEKTGKEFYVLIVWDSISSTPNSKIDAAENPDKIIGVFNLARLRVNC